MLGVGSSDEGRWLRLGSGFDPLRANQNVKRLGLWIISVATCCSVVAVKLVNLLIEIYFAWKGGIP